MKYQVFVRTWWAKDPKDPNKLIPKVGRKSHTDYVNSIEEAREWCKKWNDNNDPGKYSRKAEFTSDF